MIQVYNHTKRSIAEFRIKWIDSRYVELDILAEEIPASEEFGFFQDMIFKGIESSLRIQCICSSSIYLSQTQVIFDSFGENSGCKRKNSVFKVRFSQGKS